MSLEHDVIIIGNYWAAREWCRERDLHMNDARILWVGGTYTARKIYGFQPGFVQIVKVYPFWYPYLDQGDVTRIAMLERAWEEEHGREDDRSDDQVRDSVAGGGQRQEVAEGTGRPGEADAGQGEGQVLHDYGEDEG